MVDVPSICAVPDCDKPATSRGWCGKHYMRWVRNGDPAVVTINLDPDWRERFWSKVDKNGPVPEARPDLGPCWIWTSTLSTNGYGIFSIEGRGRLAHRLAYTIEVGEIPDGLETDHLCRVPACVRPTHLEPVTHLENVQRYCLTCAEIQRRDYFPIWYAKNRERNNRRRQLARQRKRST